MRKEDQVRYLKEFEEAIRGDEIQVQVKGLDPEDTEVLQKEIDLLKKAQAYFREYCEEKGPSSAS